MNESILITFGKTHLLQLVLAMQAPCEALVSEPQLATASALPTTATSPQHGSCSVNSTDCVDATNIPDKFDAASELQKRATGHSVTDSALPSDTKADPNGRGSAASTPGTGTSSDKETEHAESLYECNICLDTAKDSVVSLCGHLFCWPCLHQWLQTRPNRKLCPVCKAAIDKDKIIPLYGRNSTRQEDPRNTVPPRPAGQRTEPEPTQGFLGFGFGESFHMSFGIGAYPFSFFTSSLNFGEPRPPAANRGTTQYEDEQTLSKLFLCLAFLCIAWLLYA